MCHIKPVKSQTSQQYHFESFQAIYCRFLNSPVCSISLHVLDIRKMAVNVFLVTVVLIGVVTLTGPGVHTQPYPASLCQRSLSPSGVPD